MVANWLKILLFAAGGSTAAAGTVYYTGIYDPWAVEETSAPMAAAEPDEPQTATAEPASEDAPETADSVPEPETEAEAEPEAPEVAAVAEPEQPSATGDDLVVPSFDIVRVEPNGSMVIAGSAEPNSEIEVVAGADIIARAEVGPSGDFAAVLDDALRPGDYQIVLRSTGPGEGLVTTSQETAIVSVPDTQDGQVLALVEEPGAPSRLITVPEAEAEATDAPQAPADVAAADAPADPASPDVTDVDVATQPGTQDAASDAGDETTSGAPEGDVAADEPTAGETAGETGGEAQVAARSDPQTSPTGDRPASPRNSLAVEAIEIEGGTVFVAGRGAAGSTVRVYANEILLGEAQVSEGGRFLIETQTDLPVGDYIVRADIIGPGGEVTARAAVPFQREPGEAVAAVAPAQPATPAEPASESGPDEVAAADGASQADAAGDDETAAGSPAPTAQASGQQAAPVAAPAGPAREAGTDIAATAPAIEETLAAPLEAAEGAVIIRRGDTLWRISRRVYGRGVRFSTIYLANQEQIRDPDMIWPGQIFAVPDETQEGEKADMSTVSDQLAPATNTQ